MRYNTKDEIEATGEWLLKINNAEVSEELLYVPSELSKIGVAPIDVVDRLDYLRESKSQARVVEDDHDIVAHVEPGGGQEPEVSEPTPLVLDYDEYGPWEWVEPIEKMVEDAILVLYDLVPGLPDFNQLASESRPKVQRAKGKRARYSGLAKTPITRAKELASSSVGSTD